MANISPGREGYLGIIVVKSAGDQSGLKDAISLLNPIVRKVGPIYSP